MEIEKTITPKEFAEARNVHLKTVYRWIKEGRITAYQLGKKCKMSIPISELKK